MRNLRYGSKSILESSTQFAIIDTGTSFISISRTDFTHFASSLMQIEGIKCSYINGCYSTAGRCADYIHKMQDFSLYNF